MPDLESILDDTVDELEAKQRITLPAVSRPVTEAVNAAIEAQTGFTQGNLVNAGRSQIDPTTRVKALEAADTGQTTTQFALDNLPQLERNLEAVRNQRLVRDAGSRVLDRFLSEPLDALALHRDIETYTEFKLALSGRKEPRLIDVIRNKAARGKSLGFDSHAVDPIIQQGLTGVVATPAQWLAFERYETRDFGPLDTSGPFDEIIGGGLEQLLQMSGAGPKVAIGAIMGATIFGIGAVLAPTPPLTRFATVPLSIKFGAAVGGGTGIFMHSLQLETRQAFIEYKNLRDENGELLSLQDRASAAVITGMVSAPLEFIGTIFLMFGRIPGAGRVLKLPQVAQRKWIRTIMKNPRYRMIVRNAAVKFARRMGGTMVGETGTEIGQTLIQQGRRRQLQGEDFFQRLTPEEIAEVKEVTVDTMAATVIFGAAGGGSSIFLDSRIAVAQAQRDKRDMDQAREAVREGRARADSPIVFRQLTTEIALEEGISEISVPLERLLELYQEDGLNAQDLARDMPEIADRLQTATLEGDVKIPVGRYFQTIDERFGDRIVDDLRINGGHTINEAKKVTAQEIKDSDQLAKEEGELRIAEPPIDETEFVARARTSSDKVYEEIRKLLKENTGMNADAIERTALLWRARFRTRAERNGRDAFEMFTEEHLTVETEFGEREIPEGFVELEETGIPSQLVDLLTEQGVTPGEIEIATTPDAVQDLRDRFGLPSLLDVGEGLFGGRSGLVFIDDDTGKIAGFAPPTPVLELDQRELPTATMPGLANIVAQLTPEEAALITAGQSQRMVDIYNLVEPEEFAAVAWSARVKKGWYQKSAAAILDRFGATDAPRFTALLAALSPRNSVEQDLQNALQVWVAWDKAGRPQTRKEILKIMGKAVRGQRDLKSVLKAWINNSVLALTSENPEAVTLSPGLKAQNFFLNLRGEMNAVTLDAWMANFLLMRPEEFGKPASYYGVAARVREAAAILTIRTGEQWTPAEVQETVWSWTKALLERRLSAAETRSATQIIRDGGLTDEEIAKTPEFSVLFGQGVYAAILEEGGLGGRQDAGREGGVEAARPARARTLSRAEEEGRQIEGARFEERLIRAAERIEGRAQITFARKSASRRARAIVRAAQGAIPHSVRRGTGRASARVRNVGYRGTPHIFADPATPNYIELTPSRIAARGFFNAITDAAKAHPWGAAVEIKPVAEYSELRLFLTPDGLAGFALNGDDLVSAFSAPDAPRQQSAAIVALAVQSGARRLDAFDTVLPTGYSVQGFRVVARIKFKDEFAPPGWSKDLFKGYNRGEPDIVYMVYDPENADPTKPYKKGDGKRVRTPEQAVALQDEALKKITPPVVELEQTELEQAQGIKRGSILLEPTLQRVIIRLTEAANLSTFLHESGHLWMFQLFKDARAEGASAQLQADAQILLDWFGVSNFEQIGTDQHDLFARSWEAYLRSGKAPSADLRGPFGRFRQWLMQIYPRLQDLFLDRQPPQQIRDVMDRLIATDEEIAAQRELADTEQHLDPELAKLMTPAQQQEYLLAIERSREAAQSQVNKLHMADLERQRTQEWSDEFDRIEQEVTQDVNQRRVFRALHFLRTGEMLDESEAPLDLGKMDADALRTLLGAAKFRRLPFGPKGVHKKLGSDPQIVAEFFGYETASELVDEILENESRLATIETETQVRMAAENGNLLEDGRLQEVALEAINNEDGMRVMLIEDRLFTLKAGGRVTPLRVARQAAERIVAGMQVKDLQPHRFRQAAARHGRAALEAARRKDWLGAQAAKRRQVMNTALEAEARKIRDVTQRANRTIRTFEKTSKQKKLGLAGQTFRQHANDILRRFDFRPLPVKVGEKRQQLAQFIAELRSQDEPVAIPLLIMDEEFTKPWKEMTVEELLAVRDALMNIDRLATRKTEVILGAERARLDEIGETIALGIRARHKDKIIPAVKRAGEELGDFAAWVDASLRRGEFQIDRLTGVDPRSLLRKWVWNPLQEASLIYEEMFNDYTQRLEKAMDKHIPKERRADYSLTLDETRLTDQHGNVIPGINRWWLISAALNMGNASNKFKLLDGYGWTEVQLMEVLNERLDEGDFRYIQAVWDEINTLWPAVKALEERTTGIAPPKIQSTPLETRFGTFSGGYYPVVYDRDRSIRGAKNAPEGIMPGLREGHTRATTGHGHTEARIEEISDPLKLNPDVLATHLDQVILDLTHREVIQQANKILGRKEVDAAMVAAAGPRFSYQEYWVPLLRHVARDTSNPGQLGAWDQIARVSRTHATVFVLGLRASTLLMQMGGLNNGYRFLRTRTPENFSTHMLSGLRGMVQVQNWNADFADISARSAFMRNRVGRINRDMRTILRDAQRTGLFLKLAQQAGFGRPGAAVARSVDSAAKFSMRLIAWAQIYMVDIPLFKAAEKVGLEAHGMTPQEAVTFAESIIRQSQGAGSKLDQSAAERGGTAGNEVLRATTLFYSYNNVVYNQLADARQVPPAGKDIVTFQNKMAGYAMYVLAPSMYAFAVRALLQPSRIPDQDDPNFEREVMFEIAEILVGDAASTIPWLREVWRLGIGQRSRGIGIADRFVQGVADLGHPKSEQEFMFDVLQLLLLSAKLPGNDLVRRVEDIIVEAQGGE